MCKEIRPRLLAVIGSAGAVFAAPSDAADWHWDPSLSVGGIYNDNFELTRSDKTSVAGTQVEGALQIRALTPVSEFKVTPRVFFQWFPSDHDQDVDDEYLSADYIYHGQRWVGDLNAWFARQSVLSSELPNTEVPPGGLGTTPGTDTGFVNVESRRYDARITPSATFQLSQRFKLQVNAAFEDVNYEPKHVNSYTDFRSYSALVGLGYDVTPRSTLYVNAVGLRYEPDTTPNQDSNSYGVRAEWWYRTSQNLQAYLRAGLDRTQDVVVTTTTTSTRERTNNNVYGGGLTGLYQVTAFYLDLSRAVVPSGSGGLITRDQLQLRVRRSFSPRYAAFLQAYGTDDSGAQTGFEFLNRKYAVGSTGLEWRFTREFTLRGQYSYRWQKYGGAPGGANSNEFVLSLVYEPHRPANDLTLGYFMPAQY